MRALRRGLILHVNEPVLLEPHGAFDVTLVDDAGSVRNNIYEIHEVGTRKKLAMTGEEIENLPRATGSDAPPGAVTDEQIRSAGRYIRSGVESGEKDIVADYFAEWLWSQEDPRKEGHSQEAIRTYLLTGRGL